jgi:hypothetical protein
MAYVVRYFMAMHYASQGSDNPFDRHSLEKFYEWYMMFTFPPGRVAGFGDPAPAMPPVVVPAAAVAAATRNPMLQWFYEQYNDTMLDSHRIRPLELLYYDASLPSQSPENRLPLGKAYHYQGHLISSRSSWEPDSCVSVVYGKSGREAYHGHADWGQICIDGFGERLVVDLGSPPGYPKSHKDRYYNYQQFAHNVFQFGENETGGVPVGAKKAYGETTWSEFDATRGAAWTFDLSHVYGEGFDVSRTVVHLLPRTIVVLDTATLPEPQRISLRWHLAAEVLPDDAGNFTLTGKAATLTGRAIRLDGEGAWEPRRHAYVAPYNKHRLGAEFKQRHEPFIEMVSRGTRCQVISLFTVTGPDEGPVSAWRNGDQPQTWITTTPEGPVEVALTDEALSVSRDDGVAWEVKGGE